MLEKILKGNNKKVIKFNNENRLDDCRKFMRVYQTYLEIPSRPRDNMWFAID